MGKAISSCAKTADAQEQADDEGTGCWLVPRNKQGEDKEEQAEQDEKDDVIGFQVFACVVAHGFGPLGEITAVIVSGWFDLIWCVACKCLKRKERRNVGKAKCVSDNVSDKQGH